MSNDIDHKDLSVDSGGQRKGSSNARKTFAIAAASFMVMIALIAGGLAVAFLSFSNQPDVQSASGSPEPESPAGTITASVSDETTSVPDLVSRSLASASDVLRASGLDVGAVTRVYVDGSTAGSVVSQSPAAGTTVPQGSAIALTVSKGSLTASLPSVVGLTVAQAKSTLAGAGLSVSSVRYTYDDKVKNGIVISLLSNGTQQPQRGDTVSLVASKGRTPVSMPSLISLSPSAARSACSAAGLVLALDPAGASQGFVVQQTPSAGSSVVPGATVRAKLDVPPAASISIRLTKLDDTSEKYNDQLGAHITCTSTSRDDGGISSLSWQVKGLDVSASGTDSSISFIVPGYRRYGSTSIALTVVDSSGQTATVRKNITVNWDAGTLQY